MNITISDCHHFVSLVRKNKLIDELICPLFRAPLWRRKLRFQVVYLKLKGSGLGGVDYSSSFKRYRIRLTRCCQFEII